MRVLFPIVPLLLITSLTSPHAREQASQAQPSAIDLEPYRGSDGGIRPKYLVVESFFFWCTQLDKKGDRWLEFNLTRKIGIEPGSKAEETLVEACYEGRRATEGVFPASEFKNRDDYFEKQWEHNRKKIRDLATVYRQLLVDLESEGVSEEQIERHLREDVAPDISPFAVDSEQSIDLLIRFIEEFEHAFRSAEVH